MEERLAAFLVALAAFWALVWVTLRGKSNRVQVYPLLLVWRFGRSQEAYPKDLNLLELRAGAVWTGSKKPE